VNLELLAETLATEPAYRTRQVWEWAARGASSYAEMTNLPAPLRAELAERVPFSSLALAHEAHAKDGTVKALFHTEDGHPRRGVLMRVPGRQALGVPLVAVGLPRSRARSAQRVRCSSAAI